MATLGGETVLAADTGTAELQLNVAGLPLPDFGAYTFNIYLGDRLVKSVGFMVLEAPKPTVQ